MTHSVLDWRTALSVLLPDDVDADRVGIAFGATRRELPGASAIVRIGCRRTDTRGLPMRYRFLACPPLTSSPRFLFPPGNRAAIRHMLRPRAQIAPGARRALHRFVESLPPPLVEMAAVPVEIQSRSAPLTLARLHETVPGAELGCFLGNRIQPGRAAICAFDGDRLRAVAKVVMTIGGAKALDHEAAILRDLAALDLLRGQVPRLKARFSIRSGEVLLTDAFHGKPAPTVISPALQTWLDRCRHGEVRPLTRSALVMQTVERARERGEGRLAQRGLELIAGAQARSCVVHGDFVPWNIVTGGGRSFVFDWEHGILDGVPAWDELFFAVQVGLIASRWNEHQLAGVIWTKAKRQRDGYSAMQYLGMAILLLLDLRARYESRCDHPRERVVASALKEIAHGDVAPTVGAGRCASP